MVWFTNGLNPTDLKGGWVKVKVETNASGQCTTAAKLKPMQ